MKRVWLLALVIAAGAASSTSYAGAGDGDDATEGRRLFTQVAVPPCALCHTLKDASAKAEIGPSLDELKPDVVHVLSGGRIVATGGPELAEELERTGYAAYGDQDPGSTPEDPGDPFAMDPFADPLA